MKSDALVKPASTRGSSLSRFPLNLTPKSTSLTNATHRCVFDLSSTKSHYQPHFQGQTSHRQACAQTLVVIFPSQGWLRSPAAIIARLCCHIIKSGTQALLQHWQVLKSEQKWAAGAEMMKSEIGCCGQC